MLRDTSEIAVEISVTAWASKPSSLAKARPACRAATTSWAVVIGTRSSVSVSMVFPDLLVEIAQALLEIQGRPDSDQRQPQLHHTEGYLRLDADDDRFSPAQSEHV